jgi:hypothetical protein
MAIDPAELKWYRSTTVDDTTSNGGVINTGAEITTNSAENIFPDVTNAQRVTGVTQYRKIFLYNNNADTYTDILGWISTNTPATNSAISIVKGTASDTQADADDYTYVSPDSAVHADVLDLDSLAEDASVAIWIKRVITASGLGYTNDTFTISVTDT